MIHIRQKLPLADSKRFMTIQDLTRLRPDCGAAIDDMVVIDNEPLLVIDLSNIRLLLNLCNSPEAIYVRSQGVVVESYCRSESIPVLWCDPFLLLPLSHHLKGRHHIYEDMANLVGAVSCPSGTLLLLPYRMDMPTLLKKAMNEALAGGTGVKVGLPNGTYRVFYEQFEPPKGRKKEYYRNIAVQRQ